MVDLQQRLKLSGIAALLALAVAGCGGGSGTTPSNNTPATNTSSLNLKVADTLSSSLRGNGDGGWGGDGGVDAGNADGAGAAGDGEFIRFSVKFPNASSLTGTLSWKVLVSQYGIEGQEGTLEIERDFASPDRAGGAGGYKVKNPTTTKQANFLVSASGQVSGTLPLKINNETKDILFNGMRFNNYALPAAPDATQAFSDIQGMYGFAGLSANSGSGSNADTVGGFLKINADGSARFCEVKTPADHSSTCLGGLNATLSFDDPNQRNVIIIKPADQAGNFNAYAVVHTFKHPAGANNTGVSMTIDYKNVNDQKINRTGVMFASRLPSSALAAASAVGAWNVASVNIYSPGNSNASTYKENLLVAIKDFSGTVKVRAAIVDSNSCKPVTGTLTTASGINGALQITDSPSSTPTYLIMMDEDSGVAITPLDPSNNDTSIALVRRYSKDPGLAPCQPI